MAGDLNVTGLFALNKVVFFYPKTVHYKKFRRIAKLTTYSMSV